MRKIKLNPYTFFIGSVVLTIVVLGTYYSVVDGIPRLVKWLNRFLGIFNVYEGMTNQTLYGCEIKKCSPESGCVAPTGIDGNCDEEIYKDKNGNLFKKCYYDCPDANAPCAYDECCKAVCPPVYFRYTSTVPIHPSKIIHTDDVLPVNGGSSVPVPKYIPKSHFEPDVPIKQNTDTGVPMPEYDPSTQMPATEPAKFPKYTESEVNQRNQAFMEGDMTMAKQNISYNQIYDPKPMSKELSETQPQEYHEEKSSEPVGYSDVFIP